MSKKVYKIYKLLYLLILFLAQQLTTPVFSQNKLEDKNILATYNAMWNCVISGEAVSPPRETSYGFVVLTDAKTVCACSEKGTLLWEKKLANRPDPLFSVVSKDFLVTISDKKTVSLINPNGMTLWSNKMSFQITHDPITGRDGRILVRGKENIACLGMNGICKWSISTPSLNRAPLSMLNDGTFLAILNDTADEKSLAIRISPFGNILEKITLPAEVSTVLPCDEGVIISFSLGGIGLCSVTKNKIQAKYIVSPSDAVFKSTRISKGTNLLSIKKNLSALILQTSSGATKAVIFENTTGNIKYNFQIAIPYSELTNISTAMNETAIFFSGKKEANIYDFQGKCLWSAELPSQNSKTERWNFITFTKNDFVVICSKSWAMSGYKTINSKKNNTSKKFQKKQMYKDFYNLNPDAYQGAFSKRIEDEILGKERTQILKTGFYAEKEAEYTSKIFSATLAYRNMLSTEQSIGRFEEKKLFVSDKQGLEELFTQLALLGTDEASEILADTIYRQKDYDCFTVLMKAASVCAYDPDQKILSAIESQLLQIPVKNSASLIALSDAVYEICRFMGRSAFHSHCLDIQKALLSSKYSKSIHEAARKNLAKIAALKI